FLPLWGFYPPPPCSRRNLTRVLPSTLLPATQPTSLGSACQRLADLPRSRHSTTPTPYLGGVQHTPLTSRTQTWVTPSAPLWLPRAASACPPRASTVRPGSRRRAGPCPVNPRCPQSQRIPLSPG